MSHAFHDSLPDYDSGNVLHDGCPECEHRARSGLAGVLELDTANAGQLWRDMLGHYNVNAESLPEGRRLSACDGRLHSSLYLVYVLLERQSDLTSGECAKLLDRGEL